MQLKNRWPKDLCRAVSHSNQSTQKTGRGPNPKRNAKNADIEAQNPPGQVAQSEWYPKIIRNQSKPEEPSKEQNQLDANQRWNRGSNSHESWSFAAAKNGHQAGTDFVPVHTRGRMHVGSGNTTNWGHRLNRTKLFASEINKAAYMMCTQSIPMRETPPTMSFSFNSRETERTVGRFNSPGGSMHAISSDGGTLHDVSKTGLKINRGVVKHLAQGDTINTSRSSPRTM